MATQSVTKPRSSEYYDQLAQNLEEASVILCGVRGIVDMGTEARDAHPHVKDALYGALRLLTEAKAIVDRTIEEIVK